MAILDPVPVLSPIGNIGQARIHPDYERWLALAQSIINNQPQQIGSTLTLTAQAASIVSTSIPLPALTNGTYRVGAYLRVTTADGVSSSIQLTLGWTQGSQALTKAFSALTGDTVTTVDSVSLPFIQIDQGSALTYATTYASNTPGKMKYTLILAVEKI